MSLEAIEKVTQVENEVRERRAAAEAEAKQLVADAEKEGQALLQRTRAAGAEAGRELLRQAEERAAAAAERPPGPRRRTQPSCARPPKSAWRLRRSLLSEGL